MDIGPLEYVVIGVPDQQLTNALFSVLNEIHESGKIRVVDLIFITKAEDGTVSIQELNEGGPVTSGDIKDDLLGLLTAQDIEHLTGQVPAGTTAIVILFEHTWVIGLIAAIHKGGGRVFTGGMIHHEALAHVRTELAKVMDDQNA